MGRSLDVNLIVGIRFTEADVESMGYNDFSDLSDFFERELTAHFPEDFGWQKNFDLSPVYSGDYLGGLYLVFKVIKSCYGPKGIHINEIPLNDIESAIQMTKIIEDKLDINLPQPGFYVYASYF